VVPETNSANITGSLEQTTALDILVLAASQPSHTDLNTDDVIAEVINAFLANATTPTSYD